MTVDVASLRALLAAATPAPWHVNGRGEMVLVARPGGRDHTFVVGDGERGADKLAIVALRNAAPDLLAELEVLRVVSERSKALHDSGEFDRLRRLEAAVLARADAETAAGFAHEGTDWRPAFERCRVAKQAERAAISEARAARDKAGG